MRDVGTMVGRLLVETAHIAGDGGSSAAPIDVVAVLHAQAARWPSRPEDDVLHALCRRLGVAKQVWTSYDGGWKRRPDAMPLDPGAMALLAAVCLAGAAAEGERGLRFKALNGALTAIDRLPADASITLALGEAASALTEALA